MKGTLFACNILVLLAFSTPVCAAVANAQYTEDKQDILITANSPSFTIKLKSNPSTGYSWFLQSYNHQLIIPVKHSYQLPADKNLPGSSGYEIWTFKGAKSAFVVPQQTQIKFSYTRPWQHADDASQAVFWISTAGQ